MTHEEILKKAVKKARENGYAGYELPKATANQEKDIAKASLLTQMMQKDFGPIIIFRHDFAEAFWGNMYWNCSKKDCKQPRSEFLLPDGKHWHPGWKNYLVKMVLEEDPIKYLEKFL